MRVVRIALVVGMVLAVAGCGGGATTRGAGPEGAQFAPVSLVLLDFKDADHNYVFFTKPKDEAKFDKLLESGDDPQVHRKIEGWTVFADNQQSLGNFERARSAGDPLSANKEFKEAMEDLPEDAALRGFVSGQAIYDLIQEEAESDADARDFQRFTQTFGKLESISFSALAEDEGVSVEAAF